MKSNLKQDLENLSSGLAADVTKIQKRIHSLEQKIGNTNVEATLTSDAERITYLENTIKKLAARLDYLEVGQVE